MRSKLEQMICDWYPNEKVVCNSRELLGGKEIDIYFPKHKLGIEVDGLRWHTEFSGRGKDYHDDKLLKCLRRGIRLLNFYDCELKKHANLIKSVIDREMMKCFVLNSKFVKSKNLQDSEITTFLNDNSFSHVPCSHKAYLPFVDKIGIAFIIAVRLESFKDHGETLVVTDVVFRRGLHVLNWCKLVTDTVFKATNAKGLIFALQATTQPILIHDLIKSGYNLLGVQPSKHSWYGNGKIYKDVEDQAAYTRIFPYGYAILSGGSFTNQPDFKEQGFTLWNNQITLDNSKNP